MLFANPIGFNGQSLIFRIASFQSSEPKMESCMLRTRALSIAENDRFFNLPSVVGMQRPSKVSLFRLEKPQLAKLWSSSEAKGSLGSQISEVNEKKENNV